jgi:GAF domain-containing protein
MWAWLVIGVASVRSASAIVLYLSAAIAPDPHQVPSWVFCLLSFTFTALGLGLAVANRRDVRAAWLGGLFCLVGSALVIPLSNERTPGLLPWLNHVRPEAFTGAFLWYFLTRFPLDLEPRSRRIVRTIAATAALIGAWCMAANLAALWVSPVDAPTWWTAFLRPRVNPRSRYWLVIFGMIVPALPVLLWRARMAQGGARRRVRLFVGGLLGGFAPFAAEVLVEELWPSYKAFAQGAVAGPWIGSIIFGALAVVPFITAYSVLFDQVVEMRVALRAALQYALARYTIIGATLVPFAALTLFLVERRQESLASILVNGPRPVLLIGSVALGLSALRLRAPWLDALDRRYFRESYDARQILTGFVGVLPAITAEDIGARIRDEIDRALHADAEVFLADEARTAMRHVDDRLPPVGLGAVLADLALADPRPMDVDLANPSSPLHRLPAIEQRWLQSGRFSLLVALRRGGGGVAGLLALTPKRSGLPFSPDDRRLLSAIASAAGLALDSLRLRSTPESPVEPAARECLECSRLSASDAVHCACGGDLVVAAVPHTLRGVFRLEQRIGAGGMGIVYRAVDLNLSRDVAIKALPRVTPQHVVRLRREARAMASITHPNLAVIHGVETWRGMPFLVQEFVAGGTLAQRLSTSRPGVPEVLDLGITLAAFLDHLHRNGVVHCDIKPSNIGFTLRGVVKVLDFGLARLLWDAQVAAEDSTTGEIGRERRVTAAEITGGPFGTPHFMSPEAIRGDRPAPSVDLWALAVVLYEAIAGRRPFDGHDAASIYAKVAGGLPPDIRENRPDASPALSAFFAAAFAPDLSRRPPDAATLGAMLRRLRDDYR